MKLELPIAGTKKTVVKNQRASDIIKLMLLSELDSQRYYPALNKFFNTGNDLQTAKKIFQYTQDHFKYDREPPESQNVKTVARVIHDVYNDCKGYSTFILCALRACGIPVRFRFASYNYWDKTPTHVYTVATIKGREYILDGVIKRFNEEAAYKHISDVKPKPLTMALNYLGEAPIGSKASRKANKAKRKAKREEKKESGTRIIDKAKKVVAKVGAAPSRAAFLALVSLNAFKLGDKLAEGYRKDPNKIKGFWQRVGGDFDSLKGAINKRAKQAINEPVSLSAAIAAATPILIAAKKIIDELGLFKKDGSDKELMDLDQAITDGTNSLSADPNVPKTVAVTERNFSAGKIMTKRSLQTKDVAPAPAEAESDTDAEGKDNTLLYVGIGVAAVVLLSKSGN